MQWMNALDAAFSSVHMQAAVVQINLSPAQRTEFSGTQAMTIRKQDRSAIPGRVAPSLVCSLNQPLHLRFG
jgi:hypothetical protein